MNRIEVEKQKNIDFAEAHGISEVEMNNIFNEMYDEMPEDLDEGKKTIRSLRKTRGALKRLVQSGDRIDGMLLMRFPNQEYNLYAWNQVDQVVQKEGLDAAIKKGMANKAGEYLHTKGFNKGQPIDKTAIYGNAVGLFETKNGVVPREISIGSYAIDSVIPICKDAKFVLKENNKKQSTIVENSNIFYYKNSTVTEDIKAFDDDAVDIYLGYIKEFFGDTIFDDEASMLQYFKSRNYDRGAFAVIEGCCLDIRVPQDPTRDASIQLDVDGTDVDVWVHAKELEGLNIYDGAYGYLFLNAYKKNTGEVAYRLGGFLPISEDVDL